MSRINSQCSRLRMPVEVALALNDILVYMDDHPSAAARADVAANLAAAHDAHLSGLYVIAPLLVPTYIEAQLPLEVHEAQQRREADRAEAARMLFEGKASAAGLANRMAWRSVRGDPTDMVAAHARYADLVVVGQIDGHFDYETPTVLPDDLVFDCGRPILVVPYAGSFSSVGKRVLIGWNDSREAARAVGDAMPVLEAADRVFVLSVGRETPVEGLADDPGVEAARHLAHHRIEVETHHYQGSSHEVGDAILNMVSDMSCDLVVMGAYGHSRLRTIILGSHTSHMLQHMTVPVLMSH